MARIDLYSLKTGMTLKADVRDITGRLLLKAGEVITDRHLSIFKAWGVTEAEVDTPEGAPDEGNILFCDPQFIAESEAALHRIFILTDMTDPFIKELYMRATARKAKILGGTEI